MPAAYGIPPFLVDNRENKTCEDHPTFIGVAAVVDVHGRGAGEPRIELMLTITSALHSRLHLEYKPFRFVVHFLTLFLGMASLRESVLPCLDTRKTLK